MTQNLKKDFDGKDIPDSIPDELASLVMFWDDERPQGNNLVVMLRAGYRYTSEPFNSQHDSLHTMGASDLDEAIDNLRATEPCNCHECERMKVDEIS